MIGVVRQDEEGTVEAEFDDPEVVDELLASAPSESHCLQYIDPYGDTVFNRLQVPVLVRELRELAGRRDAALRARAEALVAFVEAALREPHTYVRFVGD